MNKKEMEELIKKGKALEEVLRKPEYSHCRCTEEESKLQDQKLKKEIKTAFKNIEKEINEKRKSIIKRPKVCKQCGRELVEYKQIYNSFTGSKLPVLICIELSKMYEHKNKEIDEEGGLNLALDMMYTNFELSHSMFYPNFEKNKYERR